MVAMVENIRESTEVSLQGEECNEIRTLQKYLTTPFTYVQTLGGYNLKTKPCRPVDHGPVCSGPKGDILQTKYLADETLCGLYSE